MTYLSGLSGGSWPVMGLSTYNFPTIPDMVGYWHVDESPFFANTTSAHRVPLKVAFEQLLPKFKAGYNISVVEMLGRAMAYEFAVSHKQFPTRMPSTDRHIVGRCEWCFGEYGLRYCVFEQLQRLRNAVSHVASICGRSLGC